MIYPAANPGVHGAAYAGKHRVVDNETVGCAARSARLNMAGFSYLEILIAIVLISVALVPAMDALLPAMQGTTTHEALTEDHYQLMAKIEDVMAEPFASLDAAAIAAGDPTTASSYSDVFTYANGRQISRTIFLSRYDADNADADDDPFTGTDAGVLWVQGIIAGSSLRFEILTSVYD